MDSYTLLVIFLVVCILVMIVVGLFLTAQIRLLKEQKEFLESELETTQDQLYDKCLELNEAEGYNTSMERDRDNAYKALTMVLEGEKK